MSIAESVELGIALLLPNFLVCIVQRECKASQIEGHIRWLLIDLPDEKIFRGGGNFLIRVESGGRSTSSSCDCMVEVLSVTLLKLQADFKKPTKLSIPSACKLPNNIALGIVDVTL